MNPPHASHPARALCLTAASLVAALSLPASPVSAAASSASSPTSDGATRRFTLAIGSHEGGKGRDRLLFSASDALAFRHTLEELGGLNPGDAVHLADPDSATVLQALEALAVRVKAAKRGGARTEALVYYSGHADEKGLLLGNQSLDYRVFRDRMNTLGADVRIAVVDACASGALTRMKGGRAAPAFMVDKSSRSEGYAFLTSSSESEVAQESDRLRGSFFTHALNTGLRGAADASRDGRVTLHEAYQFAYHETLERTASTRGGPQHAGYEIQLSGSGDVVLTDLRQASSSLVLSEELHGRLFIRDSLEHLAAELQKPAGREVNLGLPPGRYGLRLLQGSEWSAATVNLREGKTAVATPTSFRPAEGEVLTSRGRSNASVDTGFHHVPIADEAGFSSAIFYDVQKEPWHGTQLALIATDARSHLRGGQLAMAFNVTRGDMEGYQAAIGLNAVGGSLHGFQIAQTNVVSDDVRGVQLGGVLGVAGGHVRGMQCAGIFNIAGGGLDGWQLAGIFGVTGGSTKGAQLAGIFNATADSVRGGQGAGIFNVAGGSVTGGQGAGIFNAAGGDVRGGQGAGIYNAAWGKVEGGQGAGVFNVNAGGLKGGQGAGVFNAVWGDVKGGQGAGIFNVAVGEVRGAQAAGIFNASLGLRGLQVAPILNITGKANGYQIGLVNLSDEYESGVPIGLVNISRKGSFEGEVWVEESGLVFAGLRTGTRWMHSQFAVGAKKIGDRHIIAPTLGMAGEISLGESPLYLETGLLYSTLFETQEYSLNDASVESDWGRLRFGLGWKAVPYVTMVGGLSYNVMYHPHSDRPLTGSDYPYFTNFDDQVSMWPGAWVGIRIGN
jgi:hypothetical protein